MFLWYSDILNFKKLEPFGLRFQLRPNKTGFPMSPHLLRQMPFRIDDYSETTSSPAWRDFAKPKTCRSEAEIPSRGAYLR
jgi:hypothetical protein